MMTGGKVIVTYKRKRPPVVAYKCRRLPLRDELDQKNENCDLKVESTTINEWECPVEGSKHAPEEKEHLYCSLKEEQRNLAVAVKASESENKNQNIPNLMQLVTEPLAVLETNPVLCLKEDGLSVKDEANSLCTSVATKRKLDPWLITYQRRCKRKKDVNELQVQHEVGINRDGSLESTSSISAQEATQSKRGSEPLLVAHKNSCPAAGSSHESECFKQVADNKRENIRSEDTSSVAINTQIAEVSPCSNNAFQEDMLGKSSNDATVNPAPKTASSSLDFQEGPLGNTSNNDRTIDHALQFPEGPSGNSSNDATILPGHEPVNTGLEFQEVPLGNLSNNDTVHPSLEPVNSGLEFHEVPLGNSSNNATAIPALEPVTSGLEFQEDPLKNTSNSASTIDPVLEFPEGPLGNSSNHAVVPALEPVNSGLGFQEGALGNSLNNFTIDPALKPVNYSLEFQEGHLGNSSNNATVDPALEPVNSGLESQEGPLGNSSNSSTVDSALELKEGLLGNSLYNASVGPPLKPVLFNKHSSSGEETPVLSGYAPDTRVTHEIFPCRIVKESLDLSVPPPGNASVGPALKPVLFYKHSSTCEEYQVSSGDAPDTGVNHEIIPCSRVVKDPLDLSVPLPGDCDTTSVLDEIPLCISLDAPSGEHPGEHNALSNVESPGVAGFDLLHENKSEAAVVHSYNELTNSSPAGTLRSSYLQLFPEDRMDDLSRSSKMHQRDTAGSSSRGKSVNPSETSDHDRTAKAKSSLLYGLFLPVEVINDGHKYGSASSQWSVGGTQYRDFLRDGSSKDFPGQSSTSQRRRKVADGMVDRARTPKRSRLSPSSLYGYPAMWSEEELDSLWIGVRRYGRGNWEFMLRDPRLAFTPLRTPWDLALQWEQEQSKLLNNIPSVEGRQFRQSTALQGMIGRHHLVEGVNLSLGDVYSGASLQNNAPRHHQQTATSMRPAQDADCSVSANSSTGRNCPHWLKEIVALPPKPTEDTAADLDRQNGAEIRGPGDLIMIESDASSEETISDDRGAKM